MSHRCRHGNGDLHPGEGEGETSLGNLARDEDIRRRAYEIYLERGEEPYRELDDWLRAERELEAGVASHAKSS